MKLEGSIVAIVTPIKNGCIDESAYLKLLDFHIKKGTDGIVTCGCTGEPATMAMEEHKSIVEKTVDFVEGRVPVIAGTGSNNTKEAIELTQFAEKAGADAALLITPYYNKPTPTGLYRHYKEVAENVSIPIILYNVPSRTGVSILPETVAELSQIKNIVAIKEASGSIDQVSKILLLSECGFIVLSGDDAMTLPVIALGGRGVISVAANVVPGRMHEMVEAGLRNDWDKARGIYFSLLPLFKALFIETNPIPVKAALSLMKYIEPEWRLPLTPPMPENLEKIRRAMTDCGVI